MLVHEVYVNRSRNGSEDRYGWSAIMKMMNRHCGTLPVVERDNQLVGINTSRDVLLPLYPNYGDYIHDTVYTRNFIEREEGYAEAGEKGRRDHELESLAVAPTIPSAIGVGSYIQAILP
jgi:CBS domain-containing protein